MPRVTSKPLAESSPVKKKRKGWSEPANLEKKKTKRKGRTRQTPPRKEGKRTRCKPYIEDSDSEEFDEFGEDVTEEEISTEVTADQSAAASSIQGPGRRSMMVPSAVGMLSLEKAILLKCNDRERAWLTVGVAGLDLPLSVDLVELESSRGMTVTVQGEDYRLLSIGMEGITTARYSAVMSLYDISLQQALRKGTCVSGDFFEFAQSRFPFLVVTGTGVTSTDFPSGEEDLTFKNAQGSLSVRPLSTLESFSAKKNPIECGRSMKWDDVSPSSQSSRGISGKSQSTEPTSPKPSPSRTPCDPPATDEPSAPPSAWPFKLSREVRKSIQDLESGLDAENERADCDELTPHGKDLPHPAKATEGEMLRALYQDMYDHGKQAKRDARNANLGVRRLRQAVRSSNAISKWNAAKIVETIKEGQNSSEEKINVLCDLVNRLCQVVGEISPGSLESLSRRDYCGEAFNNSLKDKKRAHDALLDTKLTSWRAKFGVDADDVSLPAITFPLKDRDSIIQALKEPSARSYFIHKQDFRNKTLAKATRDMGTFLVGRYSDLSLLLYFQGSHRSRLRKECTVYPEEAEHLMFQMLKAWFTDQDEDQLRKAMKEWTHEG